MNSARSLAVVGLAALATVLSHANAFAADAESPVESLQKTYNLQVTVPDEKSVSGNLRVGPYTDALQVGDYLRALAQECKKYPTGFFSHAGVSEIIVCGDLHLGVAPIAGIFIASEKKLYVKMHWCQLGARCRISFHSFHHELGHALQSASWGDGHYDWREWDALNPPGFHYGNGGGRELMADPEKNWASWSTNQPGLLNAYSTTASWEDRSEIMAALMNDGDRFYLRDYYQRDPLIQKKVDLMANLLSKLCGPNQAKYFWEQALVSLRTPAEVASAAHSSPSAGKVDLAKAIGSDLIDATGNAVSFDTLKGKKYLLLYFSAAWCPHCRQFMPQFAEFYHNTKYRDQFEVLFVSSDHNEAAMLSYLREMPWKAVRFNSAAEAFLKANYGRGEGIPGLVLLDGDGRMLGIRKGFAKTFPHGVDEMLEIFNKKLQGE